jgi:cytochrome oxidase Cu insertion factor (SCO1/SenC/PrrC family)
VTSWDHRPVGGPFARRQFLTSFSAVAFPFQYRTGDLSMLARARFATLTIAAGTSIALSGHAAGAQQATSPAAAVAAGPLVNDMAPDFTLQGADRYGLIKTPVRLSDFRGRTVVLAFFYQARTKG